MGWASFPQEEGVLFDRDSRHCWASSTPQGLEQGLQYISHQEIRANLTSSCRPAGRCPTRSCADKCRGGSGRMDVVLCVRQLPFFCFISCFSLGTTGMISWEIWRQYLHLLIGRFIAEKYRQLWRVLWIDAWRWCRRALETYGNWYQVILGRIKYPYALTERTKLQDECLLTAYSVGGRRPIRAPRTGASVIQVNRFCSSNGE